MAKLTVHAGDFICGNGQFSLDTLYLRVAEHSSVAEGIPSHQLKFVEVVSAESINKIGRLIGWDDAAGSVIGPDGLLAGLSLGGRKNQITFAAKLKDGRKFLATTDNGTFTKLQAAVFDCPQTQPLI